MIKRLFDIVLASVGLIFLCPLILWLIWRVRKDVCTPVLFKQSRPGKNGKLFTMIKFRTMRDEFGSDGQALADKDRLTPFGQKLRSYSLDELPELWNVLKGDMSLVGPRPLLVDYLPLYSDEQARRHEVLPGVTGWAQVNGRNAISWEEKFDLDIWYVDNQTIWLDLKIIWFTIKKVITREGISGDGTATMSKFMGEK